MHKYTMECKYVLSIVIHKTKRRRTNPPHLTTLLCIFTMIAVAISVPAGLLLKYPPGIEQRNIPHFNRATPMVKSTSEITNSKITKSPFKWFHI